MDRLGNHFYGAGINRRLTGRDFQPWFGNAPHPLTAANDNFRRFAARLIMAYILNGYPRTDFGLMGDIRIVTGIFYYRANGKIFIYQAAMVGRNINVVTGQQPDAYPGRFFPIQYHLQGAFSGGGS
jgi:hypothetical protein